MKLARLTLESLEVARPSLLVVWPQGLCLDKGYDYPQVQQLASGMERYEDFACCPKIEIRAVVVKPRRFTICRQAGTPCPCSSLIIEPGA